MPLETVQENTCVMASKITAPDYFTIFLWKHVKYGVLSNLILFFTIFRVGIEHEIEDVDTENL